MHLIIITPDQFGYHIPSYYYCKYLTSYFDITYICWDHKLPKISLPGVNICYVNRKNNAVVRTIRFVKYVLSKTTNNKSIMFIKYFKGVPLILRVIMPLQFIVIDIRSGSVDRTAIARRTYDILMKFETLFFKHLTVISESLSKKLNITKKAHIVPLGAEIISDSNKNFQDLHFLYIGTLYNRNIDVTIHAFKKFYQEFYLKASLSFTIINSGPTDDEFKLREIIDHYCLSDSIKLINITPHEHIEPWFSNTNVGISYVPMTSYYDCQPATKTFEYLLSGMPVIATKTLENIRIINAENGILVNDTIEDFYLGLKSLFKKRKLFDSNEIRNNMIEYKWKNIIDNNLKKYFEKLYSQQF